MSKDFLMYVIVPKLMTKMSRKDAFAVSKITTCRYNMLFTASHTSKIKIYTICLCQFRWGNE